MSNYKKCEYFTITQNGGRKTVVAFFPDREVPLQQATTDSHKNFDQIIKGLEDGDPEVYLLFDPEAKLNQEFAQVTDRVSLSNGKVFFDLVEVNDTVAEHIIRNLREDNGFDPKPLALFMERLAANPSEHSREHLYRWLAAEQFTITSEGKIVGYKGVNVSTPGQFLSTRSGPNVIVDGKAVDGYVPNQPGSVVQMPRDKVTFDPNQTCSAGLHVGTWGYANGFGSATLEVEVDPADVVSVPSDSGGQKMRVWRYKVVKPVDAPYKSTIKPLDDVYSQNDDFDPWNDEDEDDNF